MAKIKNSDLNHFRNNEHFQFHTEVKNLIEEATPAAIKLENQFQDYLNLYQNEDTSLKRISKNSHTDLRKDADAIRDKTFNGIVTANKATLNHFESERVEAARRLKILFDTYGNIAKLPLNEETSAIANLLQELQGKYAADAAKVGITTWINKLEEDNAAYAELVRVGRDEDADRTELVMKDSRKAIDASYRSIVERLEALIVIEGEGDFALFVRKLNLIIDKYNDLLAQRKGISQAKTNKKEKPAE